MPPDLMRRSMTACLRVVLAYTNGETTYCKKPCGRYAGYAFFTNLTGRQSGRITLPPIKMRQINCPSRRCRILRVRTCFSRGHHAFERHSHVYRPGCLSCRNSKLANRRGCYEAWRVPRSIDPHRSAPTLDAPLRRETASHHEDNAKRVAGAASVCDRSRPIGHAG